MRIYERRLCSLSAPCGQTTCWEIGFPPEASIKRLLVKQTGGTTNDFSITVYNSIKGCASPSSSSGDPDGPNGPIPCASSPEMYVVFEPTAGTAGNMLQISDAVGRSFRNQDGTYTLPVRKVYVQITPEGTGDATWDLVIGGDVDVG
jgi:hypothetical protein